LSGANALAYFAIPSLSKKKKFRGISTRIHPVKAEPVLFLDGDQASDIFNEPDGEEVESEAGVRTKRLNNISSKIEFCNILRGMINFEKVNLPKSNPGKKSTCPKFQPNQIFCVVRNNQTSPDKN